MLRKASFFLVASLVLLGTATSPVSADGCPAGTIPITVDNRAAATAAGIPASSQCWNSSDASTGSAASDVKLWLQQHATKSVNISCMDPQFAEKLKTFMEAVPGGVPTIISGYRPPEAQVALVASGQSKAGPCQSYHNYGLAADFNSTSQIGWMRANSQQYGINTIGTWDPNHFQDARGRFGQCGACSNYRGEGALPDVPASRMPFDQQVRQALGVPPPPPPPMQQQPAQPLQSLMQPAPLPTSASSTPPIGTLNSTPYPPGTCNPQTYCSQGDGNIYYRATTCVDQVYQKCANGCSGLICTASSTSNSQVGGLLSPDGTNDNSNTNSNTNGTSTFDLIDFFANPPVAMNIGTATPIDISQLIENTGNASVLQPPPPAGKPIQTPPQGSTGYGPVPQQTFTSPDLANSPSGYGAQSSTFQAALANIKAILIDILNHLQPFGGRIGAPQVYAE